MKEKLKSLIETANIEMEYSEKRFDQAVKLIKILENPHNDHPAYKDIGQFAHVYDHCRCRISAFEEVIEMFENTPETKEPTAP